MTTPIPQETFGSLLRFYRQDRNFTQGQLAEQAGYDRSYLSYLERGLRNPTREVVLKLGRTLGLAAAEQNRLLLAAQFAADDPLATPAIDMSDRVVQLIACTLNDLPEPRRSAFREELAGFVRYLRARYAVASAEEVRAPDSEVRHLGQ